ncbi:MAG: PucR family transcriptional regulator ligand-binding domain-containing protein [Clostridium sp.]
MSFSVKELLDTQTLNKAKILGGEDGINNEIKGVTIIEAPDIVKFINGGEVLLTGLYAFKSCSVEIFKGYLEELSGKNVSALIIKRGRNVEFSDTKIELLSKFAEDFSIPVLEVPFEISFRDIMSLIMEHLFNEEVTRLKYFKTTHDNFAALSLSLNSAENAIERIIDVLAKMLGNPVAIFNYNKACIATTSKEISSFKIDDSAEQVEVGFYSNYNYLKQRVIIKGEERIQYLIYLNITMDIKRYLVITEINRAIDTMDYIAIENAITEVLHECSRQNSILELEKKFQNDIIYNLLNGKIHSKDQLLKSTNLLDMELNGNYRVLVFGLQSERADVSLDFDKKAQYTNILNDAILMYCEEARVQNDLDRVIVIQKVDIDQKEEDYRKEIKTIAEKVQKYITKHLKELRVKAGVGKRVAGIINLPKSFKEAKDAYHFADVAIEISNVGISRIILFSDLGIFKLLCQIEDTNMLLEYIPQSLQKLINYKKSQREDLLITLKTYLERNQNLKKTAEDLYIHYKTAAYRIEKITNITGIDFDNPSEVLAIRIGFIVHKMMENYNSQII